jgi:hypothetical protein
MIKNEFSLEINKRRGVTSLEGTNFGMREGLEGEM